MTVPATISRRRWLIGAGLITVSALVTADGCAAQRVGRFGFTVSSPQPGLEEFERDVRAVHELGAEWVRFGVVGFEVIRSWSEKGELVFNPERLRLYDSAFAFVESLGMSVCLLTVDGAPASQNTPEYFAAMKQYWGQLAQRFGSSVAVWQVYNEASDLDFRTARAIEGDLDTYLSDLDEALGVARESIHAHASHVQITTSASGYPVNDEREQQWLRFFAAVSGHLDICTVDFYPVLSRKAMSSLPRRIERLGQQEHLPVSVGEFGLQTGPGLYTEAQQAESLVETIGELSQSAADPVFVYRLRNDGASQDDGFGLFEIDGTPKSSLPKVAAAISRGFPDG
ncbi:hypothetical protein [Brevibacterium sp.]|uniref:hypothetical protein n=1 Tax=Brevibacterium TaxID=1696 RepID=UPI002648D7EA|nr:hypothetical protein [Brevibacterium sp.]MDN5585101.1 hypothetical protein [Brevibacterium sp.]MDN5806733.1 hypothetical protein [Brevibacterium sp.]MDN5833484.1 hypothetical protein [Brevibacterium sp.]MDN5876122.1 hypothetical protein [Brevibacterium sp.]MDN5908846.1 hypothetical protein [Brevibacterium sp.]